MENLKLWWNRPTKRQTCEYGGVAQLGEHLPCKQGVDSSILFVSTTGEPPAPNRVLDSLKGEFGNRGEGQQRAAAHRFGWESEPATDMGS